MNEWRERWIRTFVYVRKSMSSLKQSRQFLVDGVCVVCVCVCAGVVVGAWRYSVPASNKPFRCLFVCLVGLLTETSASLHSVVLSMVRTDAAFRLKSHPTLHYFCVPLRYVTLRYCGWHVKRPEIRSEATWNCAWSRTKLPRSEYGRWFSGVSKLCRFGCHLESYVSASCA